MNPITLARAARSLPNTLAYDYQRRKRRREAAQELQPDLPLLGEGGRVEDGGDAAGAPAAFEFRRLGSAYESAALDWIVVELDWAVTRAESQLLKAYEDLRLDTVNQLSERGSLVSASVLAKPFLEGGLPPSHIATV